MWYSGREVWLCTILTFAIGVCSVLGDFGLKYGKSISERAIVDNATHATVGGLMWALILVLLQKPLARNLNGIFFCFLLASFIDLDHFIAARSWHIDNVIYLEKRPFLHCTTVPIMLWAFLIALSNVFYLSCIRDTSWMILAAFLSHHIRDGTRRGLWFCPFGSTRVIPYWLYVSLSMSLPYILYWLMNFHIFTHKSYNNVTFIVV